jgi:hypothetical protein
MKRSQANLILDYLASGRALTGLDALDKFGCIRMAARVKDLRELGHDIRSEMIRDGDKRYAEYWLAYPAKVKGPQGARSLRA